jgi:hypothetical protein
MPAQSSIHDLVRPAKPWIPGTIRIAGPDTSVGVGFTPTQAQKKA